MAVFMLGTCSSYLRTTKGFEVFFGRRHILDIYNDLRYSNEGQIPPNRTVGGHLEK